METVYLETTVIGMIASRDHPDAIILARQIVSRRWWATARATLDLRVSDLVVTECSAGDANAAAERLAIITSLGLVISPVYRQGDFG